MLPVQHTHTRAPLTSQRGSYARARACLCTGEPAINVYTADGRFGPHKDHLALTVLIPLTSPSRDFAGGGTGFWYEGGSGSGGGFGGAGVNDDNKGGAMPDGPPTAVLKAKTLPRRFLDTS